MIAQLMVNKMEIGGETGGEQIFSISVLILPINGDFSSVKILPYQNPKPVRIDKKRAESTFCSLDR